MFCEDVCLGATRGIDKLRAISDELSEKVVEQLTGNQELVMITDLERESNDYQYKKCVKDRSVFKCSLILYINTFSRYLILKTPA